MVDQHYQTVGRDSALLNGALALIDLDYIRAYGPVRFDIDHINRDQTS